MILGTCPVCLSPDIQAFPSAGDYTDYHCPKCGDFRVGGPIERRLERNSIDYARLHIEPGSGDRRWLKG